MKLCAWGEGDASFHRSHAKSSGRTIAKKHASRACTPLRMCIIGSMSKAPTGITTGDVVAFLISPALLAAKWTAEGCEVAAKARKSRVRVAEEGIDGLSIVLGVCGIVLMVLHLCGIV